MARRDITPPVGIYHRMWGAATHDRSTGVHRPLLATALALAPADEGQQAASGSLESTNAEVLVSIDHCLLWGEDLDALRRDVCRLATVEPRRLHVTFSHTHAAGLMDRTRADLPGGDLIGPYLDQLAQRVAQAVREALDALAPVQIVYGEGRCALAANRDFWDRTSGQFVCGFNPAGPCDDTLTVARITDEQSRCLGTIVNYACHPTTLAWDNSLISPDFVGATRELVEEAAGGLCLFLQGASGDLGPRRGFVGDTATADRNGRELGYAALAALEALPRPGLRYEYAGPVISGATIGVWHDVPFSSDERCQKQRWRAERFEVELDYRADLPTRDETDASRTQLLADETAALARGDVEAARRARAEAERMTRQLARLRGLPPGNRLPCRSACGNWATRCGYSWPVNITRCCNASCAGDSRTCRWLSPR